LPAIKSRQLRRQWQRRLLQAELTAWSILILFAAYRLVIAAPLTTLFLVGLLLLPLRYWWQDFLPGLLFRMDGDAEAGDLLNYKKHRYVITAIRSRSLKLRGEDGTQLTVPYRFLEEVQVTKAAQKTALTPFVFQIETNADDNSIEQLLTECPWIAPGQPAKFKWMNAELIEVTTFAPSEGIKDKQEVYLREKLK